MSKLEKILNKLPEGVAGELEAMDLERLKAAIIASEQAVAQAKTELDDNLQYQAAKQATKDLSSSFRELKSYQNAKIQYALILLEEKGNV